jgi:hypothetical protein
MRAALPPRTRERSVPNQGDIDYLRRKARQFRELASENSDGHSKKMVELAEALERNAAELEQRMHVEVLKEATLAYRIYFRHQKIGIVGRDEFEAEDDRAAIAFAEVLCDACSDVCDHFELWQGVRRVGACDRGECAKQDAWRLNAQTQAAAAEHEERLLDSKWAIAKSRRLLAQFRNQIDP